MRKGGDLDARSAILLFGPCVIWIVVLGILPELGVFDFVLTPLRQGCSDWASWLPGCRKIGMLSLRGQRVGQEFLSASYIIVVGASALAFLLAFIFPLLKPPLELEFASRSPLPPLARLVVIVIIVAVLWLIFFRLPEPFEHGRGRLSTMVSLSACILAGLLSMLLYQFLVARRYARSSR